MTEQEIKRRIAEGRAFAKCNVDEESDYKSDQELKKPQPPLVKAAIKEDRIKLPTDFANLDINNNFLEIINTRSSHRVYTRNAITLRQLSYLLWCSQGVKEIRGKSYATLRTVPCGGARHEFETYLALQYVEGLKPGFYHYLPMTHELECLKEEEGFSDWIGASVKGQIWANKASVVFYWSMVAYRAEWRYGIHAHRVALNDIGFVSENLYLACTSIGLGTCASGAVDVNLADEKFGLDGDEEFIVLAQPVGTISQKDKQAELDFYAFVKEQGL